MTHDVPVVCHDVHRRFGDVAALAGFDLTVAAARVTALVGLNGAGKTTLMRALLGMCRIDGGSIRVFGLDPRVAPPALWARVGHLVETPFAYPELTVRENLWAAARLHGVPSSRAWAAVDDVIERLELGEYAARPAGRLSLGNRQRLGIAAAVCHRPELLILDEPTNALDPAGVVLIRDLVTDLARDGSAVIVSSHHLDEVSRVADTVEVVHRGRSIGTLDPGLPDLERAFFAMALAADDASARPTEPVDSSTGGAR